jgi:hypothetical protein
MNHLADRNKLYLLLILGICGVGVWAIIHIIRSGRA